MPRNSPKNQSPQVRLGLSIGDFEFFGEFHGITPKTPMYLCNFQFHEFFSLGLASDEGSAKVFMHENHQLKVYQGHSSHKESSKEVYIYNN